MSRYIDADANRATMLKCAENPESLKAELCYRFAARVFEEAPTIDAVPVVRCRECKWWWKVNGLCTHPKHCHDNVCVHECGKDYFCADGERRTDD